MNLMKGGGSVLRALDATAVGKWAEVCTDALDAACTEIDEINVYPVPDSDTGSNMLHTMRSAVEVLREDAPDGVGQALAALARGAVAGARGNSGVILSQLLRGCAEELREASTATGPRWRAALAHAERLATAAVARPVEGTILTVLRSAVRAAPDAPDGRDTPDDRDALQPSGAVDEPGTTGDAAEHSELAVVTARTAAAAAEALQRTPEQLAVLAEAGVVDAGGRGLVVVFDALHAVVTGAALPERQLRLAGSPGGAPRPPAVPTGFGYGYEVMYLLEGAREQELAVLRETLVTLGDCVTLAGDGAGRHAVHVHCDDIGAAIEAGIDAGRPRQIAVTPLVSVPARFTRERAVLVVVRTEQLAELVRDEGAGAFVAAGNEYDPVRAFEAIRDTAAQQVVVLAADAELSSVATGAARRAETGGQDVVVVPGASPVQALSALAVHDTARRATEDVVSMAEAAAATRYAELRIAESEALTWVGRCAPGDVLGLVEDEVVLVQPGPVDPAVLHSAACTVIERMLSSGGELVTVLLGAHTGTGVAEELHGYLHDEHPEVDLSVYPGAGTEVVLLLGVE